MNYKEMNYYLISLGLHDGKRPAGYKRSGSDY